VEAVIIMRRAQWFFIKRPIVCGYECLWVCGGRLGEVLCFVGGKMDGSGR
jgi:hypothetical protein